LTEPKPTNGPRDHVAGFSTNRPIQATSRPIAASARRLIRSNGMTLTWT
jgi:hypothetical protein